jgi:SAM-dependent methyltransferase
MKIESNWKKIYATNLRLGFGKILRGIDYSRTIEYPLVSSQLEFGKNDLVLDVGSSDSVFPVFLASSGYKVYALDIDRKVLRLEGYARKLRTRNLVVVTQDVTKLSYPDNFFDRITAISSIEHVLPVKDGDIKAIREIARTLKVGGQAIITVPYGDSYMVRWSYSRMSGHFSLMREYDENALYKRLAEPSRLLLRNKTYFGESVRFSRIWYSSPCSFFAFPAPFFSKFFMGFKNLKKPQGVCLSFRK